MIARHVVVPGITDDETHLQDLGKLLAGFRNLKGLEVLPYHTMGKVKYDKLGLSYPLEQVENMDGGKSERGEECNTESFSKGKAEFNS